MWSADAEPQPPGPAATTWQWPHPAGTFHLWVRGHGFSWEKMRECVWDTRRSKETFKCFFWSDFTPRVGGCPSHVFFGCHPFHQLVWKNATKCTVTNWGTVNHSYIGGSYREKEQKLITVTEHTRLSPAYLVHIIRRPIRAGDHLMGTFSVDV